ncbi:SKG-like transmembrane protein [Actinotignum schaalii]|uniref:SKG-like transmembrane protein n=1 Tax=Actinotignum schaalii TaxID=59505 RepID=UPI00237E21AD|nr:SKG-like transmembrane protein [Actinotignum schaalii]MDE1655345.1 SKG-like transmembrane protein [Actinotignum schaalii]
MSEEDATRSPQGGEPTRAFPPHGSENTTPSSPSADYPTQAYAANPGTYPGPDHYGAAQGNQPGLYGAGQGNQHGSAGYPGVQAGPGSQYPGQAGYPQQGNYPGQAPQYGSGQAGQYGGPGYPGGQYGAGQGGQYGAGQGGQYGAPGYPGGPGNQYPGGGPNGPNGPRGAYPAGYGQQPKQSKTGLFVGIGVGIVALIALVVGLIFFLNRDKASDDAQPDPSSVPSISAPATPDGTAAPETSKAPILDSPTAPAPAPSGNSGDSAGKDGKDGLTYTYPPEKIGALFDTFLKDPTFTEAFGKPERDDAGACIGNAAQGKLSDQFIDVLERASKGDITAGNEIEDPKFMNDLLNFILIMDSCGVNITMQ